MEYFDKTIKFVEETPIDELAEKMKKYGVKFIPNRMTVKELDELSNEVYRECRENIIKDTSIIFGKYLNKKLKSLEYKIKGRSEHILIREHLTKALFANIEYNLMYGFDSYIDEEDIMFFEEE